MRFGANALVGYLAAASGYVNVVGVFFQANNGPPRPILHLRKGYGKVRPFAAGWTPAVPADV